MISPLMWQMSDNEEQDYESYEGCYASKEAANPRRIFIYKIPESHPFLDFFISCNSKL